MVTIVMLQMTQLIPQSKGLGISLISKMVNQNPNKTPHFQNQVNQEEIQALSP